MAGADRLLVLHFVDKSLAFSETCADTKFHVHWYHSLLSYASSTTTVTRNRTWTKCQEVEHNVKK